jgi:hypothetical protein
VRLSTIVLGLMLSACATQTLSIERWNGRDIADLMATIGPADTSFTRHDASTYEWYRFGYCRLTARTTPDLKIIRIDVEGTPQGCNVYFQKIGG